MAAETKRLSTNAPGEFFVDSTCIDCDACRWIAPATFDSSGDHSRVHTQPTTPADRERAFEALIACPTGSIGAQTPTQARDEIAGARNAFPVTVDGNVMHCGWHAESSFGAASYLVRRDAARGGNLLIDSPRFSSALVKRIEELGGIATMFLTHRDDVADHRRFAQHFGCRRVIHRADMDGSTRDVDVVITGTDARALDTTVDGGALVIPTPGHTRGSMCMLFDQRYLFTGDHLAFSPTRGHLYAFRDACWFDWSAQIASMKRLSAHEFEWVLPGHGRRAHFPAAQMREQMTRCIAWMEAR